jgi:hypothetical protein
VARSPSHRTGTTCAPTGLADASPEPPSLAWKVDRLLGHGRCVESLSHRPMSSPSPEAAALMAEWKSSPGRSENSELFFVQNLKGVVGRSNILESYPR